MVFTSELSFLLVVQILGFCISLRLFHPETSYYKKMKASSTISTHKEFGGDLSWQQSATFPKLKYSRNPNTITLYSVKDESISTSYLTEIERKELWKKISTLERQAVEILLEIDSSETRTEKEEEVFQLFAESTMLKEKDPFLSLCVNFGKAKAENNETEMKNIMNQMKVAKLPPHLSAMVETLSGRSNNAAIVTPKANDFVSIDPEVEEVDPGSTFSDTVTDKIRVKVSSFYDRDKSDPAAGKFMFWYKVAIYNEGPEPVQIVARMWEIEKCRGEKEVVRGAGIMSTQPIIPPGDVFTYQSVCPLKVFPPKGKRLLGSMSGAYTMCKGNMGQHNFTVKVAKFNLILPDSESTESFPK